MDELNTDDFEPTLGERFVVYGGFSVLVISSIAIVVMFGFGVGHLVEQVIEQVIG